MGNNINPNKDNSDNYYLSNFGITKEQYDLSTNSIQDDAKKLSPYWNTPLKEGQEASSLFTGLPGVSDNKYNPQGGLMLEDFEEGIGNIRARNQGFVDEATNGLLRGLYKTGAMAVTSIPYLALTLSSLGPMSSKALGLDHQDKGYGELFQESFDNPVGKLLEDTENYLDDKFPVYKDSKVENGGFIDNIFKSEFWLSDGVDGAAFFASAWGTGGLIKMGKVGQMLAKTSKGAIAIDNGLITATNTTKESVMESIDAAKELKHYFNDKLDPNSKNYDPINPETGQDYTPDEINQIIGERSGYVFLANMALLTVPEYFKAKIINRAFSLDKSLIEKIVKEGTYKGLTRGQIYKKIGTKAITGGLAEGFPGEEYQQSVIQRYNKNKAIGNYDPNTSIFSNIINEELTAIQDPSVQKESGLGVVFGGAGGAYGAKLETANELKKGSVLNTLLKINSNSFNNSLFDVVKRDKDGNIQYDSKNRPLIDKSKLDEYKSKGDDLLKRQAYLMDALEENDKDAFEFIQNMTFSNYAYTFLREEGGLQALKSKIKDEIVPGFLSEYSNFLSEEELKKMSSEIEIKYNTLAEQAQKNYDKISLYGPDFGSKIKTNKENKGFLVSYLEDHLYAMYSEMNAQTLYKNTINSLNHEILSFENNVEGLDNPIDAIGLNKLTNKLKEYQGILNTSLAQYNEFLKETSSQKEFERYANEKIEANKTNTETSNTETPNTETPNTETSETPETPETPEPGDTDDFENPFIEPETDLETEEDYPSNETDEATHQGILELYEEDQKRKQQEGQQQQQQEGQQQQQQQQGEEEQQQQGKEGRQVLLDKYGEILKNFNTSGNLEEFDEMYKNLKEDAAKLGVKIDEKVIQKIRDKIANKSIHSGTSEFNKVFGLGKKGKELLNQLLSTSGPKNLTIKITKNPNHKKSITTDNRSYVSSEYNIVILINGTEAGFYPYYGYKIDPKTNEVVDVMNLSEKDYQRIYNPDSNHKLSDFKEAYAKNKSFHEYIANIFKNGKEEIILNEEDVKSLFNVYFTPGEFDFKRTPISDIDHLLYRDSDNNPIIIMRNRENVDNNIVQKLEPLFDTNFTEDGEIIPKLLEAFKALENDTNFDATYVTLVKNDTSDIKIDGVGYTWVQLNGAHIDNEELGFFIEDYSNKLYNTKDKDNAKEIADKINSEYFKQIYITSGSFNERGTKVLMSLSFYGSLKFEFFNKNTKESYTIELKNPEIKGKSLKQIVDLANKKLKESRSSDEDMGNNIPESFKLDIKNFRKLIDKNNKDTINNLSSTLSPNIKKNRSIILTFKPPVGTPIRNNDFVDNSSNVEKHAKFLADITADQAKVLNVTSEGYSIKGFKNLFKRVTAVLFKKFDSTKNSTLATTKGSAVDKILKGILEGKSKQEIYNSEINHDVFENDKVIKKTSKISQIASDDIYEKLENIAFEFKSNLEKLGFQIVISDSPINKETSFKLFDTEAEVAGELDVLLYNAKTNSYAILDIKTKRKESDSKKLSGQDIVRYGVQLRAYRNLLYRKYKIDAKSAVIFPLFVNDHTNGSHILTDVEIMYPESMLKDVSDKDDTYNRYIPEETKLRFEYKPSTKESKGTSTSTKNRNVIKSNVKPNNRALQHSNVSSDFVTDFSAARNYFKEKFGSQISVEHIDKLFNRLEVSGHTFGAVQAAVVYLASYSRRDTYFHEAFHIAFRNFLSNEELNELYKEAEERYSKDKVESKKKNLKKLSIYSELSDKDLHNLALEELMADEHAKWKSKRFNNNTLLGKFFNLLSDWYNIIFSNDKISAIFRKIDNGGFKNNTFKDNIFTNSTEIVLKNIPVGTEIIDGKEHIMYLSSERSRELINTIAAKVSTMIEDGDKRSFEKIVKEVMNAEKEIYNPELHEGKVSDKQFEEILDIHSALEIKREGEQPRELIAQEVYNTLGSLKLINKINDDDLDLSESETNDDITPERAFDITQDQINSFDKLGSKLKRFMSLCLYEDNSLGFKRTIAVNPIYVYNGISKYCANSKEDDIPKRLAEYIDISEQSGVVISKFFNLTNFVINEDGSYTYDKKHEQLVQQFLKGFKKSIVNSLFLGVDTVHGVMRLSNANQNDSSTIMLNRWKIGYYELKFSNKEAYDILTKFANILGEKKKYNKTVLDKLINDPQKGLYHNLKKIGFELSKGYIKYLILSGERERTKEQEDYFESNFKALNNDLNYTIESLREIANTYLKGKNPFSIPEILGEDGVPIQDVDDANKGRAILIAKDNYIFDETVHPGSYVSADGKQRYALQESNFITEKILDLKNISNGYIEPLDLYNNRNYLLMSDNFIKIQKNLSLYSIGGLRQLIYSDGGDVEQNQGVKKEGATFADFTDRDMLLFMIGSYGNQIKQRIFNKKNKEEVVTSPIVLNVMETSNTSYVVYLPVINALNVDGNMNVEYVTALYNEIVREHTRIRRFKNNEFPSDIENFTNGEKRAGEFWLGKYYLSEELQKKLINTDNIEEYKKEIVENFAKLLGEEFETYIELLKSEGILYDKTDENSEDSKLTANKLLDQKFSTGKDLAFGTKDLYTNLKQAYLSNFLNTLSINQLMQKDFALSFRDNIEYFKRAKRLIGSGPSIYNKEFTHTKFITVGNYDAKKDRFKDPIDEEAEVYYDKNDPHGRLYNINDPDDAKIIRAKNFTKTTIIDTRDAQGYVDTYMYKNIFRSLGRLTPELEKVIDRIDKGKFTKEDFLILKENNTFLNSLKLVAFDGEKFIKFSVSLISLLECGTKVNGVWEANAGMEYKFNLLQKMKEHDFHMEIPVTASKAMREKVVQVEGSDIKMDNSHVQLLDNKYFRLQVENPSNKTTIIDPTQVQHLIDSEQDPNTEVYYDSKVQKVSDIIKDYRKNMGDKTHIMMLAYNNFLFDKVISTDKSPSTVRFQKMVFNTLLETGASSQLLDMFTVIDGVPQFNLNLSPTLSKFRTLFNAHFNHVFKHKVPGYKTTMESDSNTVVYEDVSNGSIIRREKYQENKKDYDELIKIGKVKVRRLKFDVKDSKHNRRYSEIILPYHFAEMFNIKPGDTIPEKLAYMFGIRIPSQDKHSMMSLKVVDVMPAYKGSNAVFPKELVLLMGADFDIDSIFIHRYEHYFEDDEFKLYKDNFQDYLKYWKSNKLIRIILKELLKNKESEINLKALLDPNTSLSEEYIKYERRKYSDTDSPIGESYTEDRSKDIARTFNKKITELIEEYIEKLLPEALSQLGLPSTENEYNQFKHDNKYVPIPAVINDKLLDAKIALYSNPGIRSVALSPISDEPITYVGEQLSKELGYKNFDDMSSKFSPFGMLGLINGFSSNKAGGDSISVAAFGNVMFNFLSKHKITLQSEIPISFDGIIYNDFSKSTQSDNIRKMRIIDAYIGAMVDNGKFGYVNRLSLRKNALSLAMYLTSLGVPLKQIIFLLNTESVKEYFIKMSGNNIEGPIDPKNSYEVLTNILYKLSKKIKEFDEGLDVSTLSPEDISLENLTNNLNNQRNPNKDLNYYLNEYNFITNVTNIESLSRDLFLVGSIIKLNKGLDNDFEKGDTIEENLEKMQSETFSLVGAYDAIMSNNDVHSRLQAFHEYRETSSKFFIERSSDFIEIKNIVLNSLKQNLKNSKSTKNSLRRFLLGYLSTRAYFKLLSDNSVMSSEELRNKNKYAYPAKAKEIGEEDLYNKVLNLKILPKFNNNLFLKLITFDTRLGKLSIKYNTFSKENPLFISKVQDDVDELFFNSESSEVIIDLFRYLAVQDGMNFRGSTYLSLLPSYFFNTYSIAMDKVNSIFNSEGKDTEELYQEVYGTDRKTLFQEFLEKYLRTKGTTFNLLYIHPKVLQGIETAFEISDDEYIFNIFGGTQSSFTESSLNEVKLGNTVDIEWDILNDEGKKVKSKVKVTKVENFSDEFLRMSFKNLKPDENTGEFKTYGEKDNILVLKETGEFWSYYSNTVKAPPQARIIFKTKDELKEAINHKIIKKNLEQLSKIFRKVDKKLLFPYVIKIDKKLYRIKTVNSKPFDIDNPYVGYKVAYTEVQPLDTAYGKTLAEDEEVIDNPQWLNFGRGVKAPIQIEDVPFATKMSLDEINDLVEKSTGKGIFDDLVIDTDDGFYKTVPDYLSNMYKESTPSEKTELKNTVHANTFLNEDSNINPPTKNVGFGQESNLFEKNIFTVEPIQSVDKKAKSKAKIATQYIGFAEGIEGSSTALYAKQINEQNSEFKIPISKTLNKFLELFFNSNDESMVEPFAKNLTNEDKQILAKSIGRSYKDINQFNWYEAIWSDVGIEEVFYYLKTGNNLEQDVQKEKINSQLYNEWQNFVKENKEFVDSFYKLPKETQKELKKDFDKLKEKNDWYIFELSNLEYDIRKNLLKQEGYLENKINITSLYAKQISEKGNNITSKVNIPQNLVSGVESFGTKQEANSKAKKLLGNNPHSIDMIEAGLRTRTTRSVGEMEKLINKIQWEWLKQLPLPLINL